MQVCQCSFPVGNEFIKDMSEVHLISVLDTLSHVDLKLVLVLVKYYTQEKGERKDLSSRIYYLKRILMPVLIKPISILVIQKKKGK
jgi:hypothetical protein